MRRFLANADVQFVKTLRHIPEHSTLIVWGQTVVSPTVAPERIIRLEDGFLRSVGLGADLVAPLSWVGDERGMYYDATTESDLEHLLALLVFDDELLQRANSLRQAIVDARLTKYNTGTAPWKRPEVSARVVLVPGQVEDDASIKFGAPDIKSNLDLLAAVRLANPEAYLIYKPHPDVTAGLRKRGSNEAMANTYCDEIILDTPMDVLLDEVDEVHVMTSLTGFEALLRDLPVTCYGQPFYSGWGLTVDITPIARRTRKLTLDQLVAATLILYPTYVSAMSKEFTTPENIIAELQQAKSTFKTTTSLWKIIKRRVLAQLVAALRA